MTERGSGHIITISSDAGRRVFPNLSVYCASKYFVEALSEGTRRELVVSAAPLLHRCRLGLCSLEASTPLPSVRVLVRVVSGRWCGQGTGVRVTTIQPGDCATDLVMENTDKEACAAMGVTPGEKVGTGWANEWQLLQPKDVADAVVRPLLPRACLQACTAHGS